MERDLTQDEFSAWLSYKTEIKKYNEQKQKEVKKQADPLKVLDKTEKVD